MKWKIRKKINEFKSWFFGGGKKTNKPLSRLTKKEIRFKLLKSGMRGRYYNQPWRNKRDNKGIL